ncbi:hypothetical protein HELRODRAFT_186070 [Helobdella robusta]|uniref:Sugar phosphate exchanger 3 n=1 Tax=Helobdella robusta TaxID=6412 RepID=T1FNM6_HELRO|nr:hypothetical protein HELRODRAFT_186070 [Helobdella robusta]ESN93720.1 hypothetical protein HELRODRAFT_186070 [Helobdella robusta]
MDNRSSGPYFVELIYRNVPALKQSSFRNVYKYFVLFLTFVIYVTYHLSRKPLSVVKNQLSPCSDVNITSQNCTGGWEPFNGSDGKEMLGALDSCYLFTYAFFMFISGHIAERMNLRYFLFFGMLLSGISTSLFGFGRIWAIHNFWYFAVVQVFLGIVQSSGWPPVVACVANWFGKGKRGFIMGIWNSHTSVGNILGSVIAGVMVNVDWAWSFIIPGLIILGMGCVVFLLLIPHPHDLQPNTNYSALIDPDHQEADNGDNNRYQDERVRLINDDEIDTTNDAININQSQASLEQEGGVSEGDGEPIGFFKAILIPGVIEFSLCLFFAKLVSYTFLFWLPYYISKTGNYDPTQAADMSALFDVGGILGGVVAGIVSDYHGGRALTCMVMLLIAAPSMFIYYIFGGVSFGLSVFLLMVCGFFVNGPYSLITTAVSADLGTHPSLKGDSKALSTVTAIIDGTGSIGAALGPLITGLLSSYGWDYVFYMLIISDVIALLFLMRLSYKETRAIKWRRLFRCCIDNDESSRRLIS